MSENNLSNQDIIMKEESNALNAASFKPNAIITMMKKEMKINFDPNIQKNLAQYIQENNDFSSKIKNQEQVIQNLITRTSNLSQSINKLVSHCKEKYDATDSIIENLAKSSDNQISSINKDILFLFDSMNEFKNEQEKINKSVIEQVKQHQENIKKITDVVKDNETVKRKLKVLKNF